MTSPDLKAFAPIANADARTLILGSMPGARSLADTQYYAHPGNAFWPIIYTVFKGNADLAKQFSYQERTAFLLENNIAVWDVLSACRRPGSLDANIDKKSIVVNDFSAFLTRYNGIDKILFNGRTAEQLFKRHALPTLNNFPHLQLLSLPSTSPAMATLRPPEKATIWAAALDPTTKYLSNTNLQNRVAEV